MRAICKVCKEKNNCSYLKRNKEGECIDVQTSDYGYQEAIEKACKIFRLWEYSEVFCNDFKKAMEESI